MEEAESDLTHFLTEYELAISQKLLLCADLLRILKGLHSLDIYHRDIKPDNIFMLGGKPVFGDLGLVNYRHVDSDMDDFDEKIGPIGYLSPEATNKCLGIRSRASFAFDCWIDEKSDLFQLGQVFWLVLQDEVPTGHIAAGDMKIDCGNILEQVIHPMLQYGKDRRPTITVIEEALQPLMKEFALI
jgi:serine/threonine protein kinase